MTFTSLALKPPGVGGGLLVVHGLLMCSGVLWLVVGWVIASAMGTL